MADDVLERLFALAATHPQYRSSLYAATEEIESLRAERDELKAEVERLRAATEDGGGHRESDGRLAADQERAAEPERPAFDPEPRGCALPGCCAAVDTIERLRAELAEARSQRPRPIPVGRVTMRGNPNLVLQIVNSYVVNDAVGIEVEDAFAAARDETERECIKAVCPYCNGSDSAVELMPIRADCWRHKFAQKRGAACRASAIYELRYQRAAKETTE